MQLFHFTQGTSPLLVNVPHAGTFLPEPVARRLTPEARRLPDTDWFVDELYDFAPALGAGTLVATHSRYLVDLNRPPDDATLYGEGGTGLVPRQTFAGTGLYLPGESPSTDEQSRRVAHYWQPYHDALRRELERLKAIHGFAMLLDGHSIRSEIPALFSGTLPDLNLGTNDGVSAAPELVQLAMTALGAWPDFSLVEDGRFKGGHITRHYGQPKTGIHALQLELSQSAYMQEQPRGRDAGRKTRFLPVLNQLIKTLLSWKPS